MTRCRCRSLWQRSLVPELHPFRNPSLAQRTSCIDTLFIVIHDLSGLCCLNRTHFVCKPKLTSPSEETSLANAAVQVLVYTGHRQVELPPTRPDILASLPVTAVCCTDEPLLFSAWPGDNSTSRSKRPGKLCRCCPLASCASHHEETHLHEEQSSCSQGSWHAQPAVLQHGHPGAGESSGSHKLQSDEFKERSWRFSRRLWEFTSSFSSAVRQRENSHPLVSFIPHLGN